MSRSERTRRVARMVATLSGTSKGQTIHQLMRALGASRATVYRDLELLRESGFDVHQDTVNGSSRYSASTSVLASQAMTPKERAAIAVARRALGSIEGSPLVAELDTLLQRARGVERRPPGVEVTLPPIAYHPEVVAVIHAGVLQRRKLRVRYRGASDAAPLDRIVHPIEIQVIDQQPYLIAWDEKRRDRRTFKLARISRAKLLRSRATHSTQVERGDGKARSVKVWASDPVEVRIRIRRQVARFVHEWPLASNQVLTPAPHGAVDVCARVYGLEETLRWVLRWGRNAEAIAPAALREKVRVELAEAVAAYGDQKVSQRSETHGA